jgi:MtaA/CmuA family methyltransferase
MIYSEMERLRDAIKGKPRDRIPILPMNALWVATNFPGHSFSEVASDAALLSEAQIWAKETIGYDWLDPHADPLYIPEAFGCKVRFLKTGPLIEPLPIPVTRLDDLDQIPTPNVEKTGRLPVILETAARLAAYGEGRIPVVAPFEGPFTTTCRILDTETIMRMTYRNPQILESLLDRMTEFLVAFGRALIERGANMAFIPEPTASSSMISSSMFRRYVEPRLKALTCSLGVPCILHICGDTSPILGPMWQTGASVLSLDQCMSLSESRKKIPEGVLGGNVDPVGSLLLGNREKVLKDTLQCIISGGTSRFVLMSGCAVPPGTSLENLKAMTEAAKDYGMGPDSRKLGV